MKKGYLSIIAAVSIGILSIGLAGCGLSVPENTTKSFEGEQVEQIDIHTVGQQIVLRSSNDAQVKVSMNTDKPLPAALKDGVLTIDIAPPTGLVNFKTATLYVEVPAKRFRQMKLISTSGNISVENVTAEELSATTDSGSIAIKGFKGKVNAATDSGLIKSSLPVSSDIVSKDAGYTLNATIGAAEKDVPRFTLRSVSGSITLD